MISSIGIVEVSILDQCTVKAREILISDADEEAPRWKWAECPLGGLKESEMELPSGHLPHGQIPANGSFNEMGNMFLTISSYVFYKWWISPLPCLWYVPFHPGDPAGSFRGYPVNVSFVSFLSPTLPSPCSTCWNTSIQAADREPSLLMSSLKCWKMRWKTWRLELAKDNLGRIPELGIAMNNHSTELRSVFSNFYQWSTNSI